MKDRVIFVRFPNIEAVNEDMKRQISEDSDMLVKLIKMPMSLHTMKRLYKEKTVCAIFIDCFTLKCTLVCLVVTFFLSHFKKCDKMKQTKSNNLLAA